MVGGLNDVMLPNPGKLGSGGGRDLDSGTLQAIPGHLGDFCAELLDGQSVPVSEDRIPIDVGKRGWMPAAIPVVPDLDAASESAAGDQASLVMLAVQKRSVARTYATLAQPDWQFWSQVCPAAVSRMASAYPCCSHA